MANAVRGRADSSDTGSYNCDSRAVKLSTRRRRIRREDAGKQRLNEPIQPDNQAIQLAHGFHRHGWGSGWQPRVVSEKAGKRDSGGCITWARLLINTPLETQRFTCNLQQWDWLPVMSLYPVDPARRQAG